MNKIDLKVILNKINYDGNIELFYKLLEDNEIDNILEVYIVGNYRIGSEGNPDARYIYNNSLSIILANNPKGIILNMTDLGYEWGDMLEMVLDIGNDYENKLNIPVTYVVGKKSIDAILSLCFGINNYQGKTIKDLEYGFMNESEAFEKLKIMVRNGA
jgi:hypothetical protein